MDFYYWESAAGLCTERSERDASHENGGWSRGSGELQRSSCLRQRAANGGRSDRVRRLAMDA